MRLSLLKNIFKIIPIILILFISGIGLPTVYAYTQIFIGDDLFATGTHTVVSGRYIKLNSPPQNRILEHSSGKTLVVRASVASPKHAIVTVVSSTGVILANVDLYSVYSSYSTYALRGGISIAELSATEAIIFLTTFSTNTYIWFIVLNLNTYSATGYSASSGSNAWEEVSQLWYYDGNFYICCLLYGTPSTYRICRFNISTYVVTASIASTTFEHSYNAKVFGYLDSTSGLIYLCMTNSADTFEYSVYDIGAGTITLLCTNPTSGHYPDENAFRYGYGNFINYYGGGIMEDGTYLYLYHAWSWSYRTGEVYPDGSGVRRVETILWYGKFNNSISAGTLLSQECIYSYAEDSSLSTSSSCGISWGYIYHNPTTDTFDLHTYYQDIYTGTYMSKVTYHISDLTEDPSTWSDTTVVKKIDGIDFPYIDKNAQLGKDQIHGISYHMVTNVNTYLSIGEPILGKIYTFEMSYAPLDSPLKTNNDYTLTFMIYVNGILDDFNETAKIYIDGMEKSTKIIPSSGYDVGKITYMLRANTAGTYSISLKIYNSLGELEALSPIYSFTFTTEGESPTEPPTTPSLIGTYATLFYVFIPVIFVVLTPMILFTTLILRAGGGGTAVIIGLMLGGTIGMLLGVTANVIPTYVLYLFVITVISGLIILIKGNSGNSSGE